MERYEAYKDSGIAWIGEIPTGWKYGKLKQRNTLAGRIGWQGLTSDEYCDEGPYLITGVNFTNGIIDWDSCVHITDGRWEEAPQIQIVEGDLLITKDGTIGKVAIAKNLNQRASLNSGVMVIRPTSENQSKAYLYWLLQSDVFWGWFGDVNSGNSTIIHLYQGDFLNFGYYLPPLGEQKRIANYLYAKTTEIDELVADCEREVELLLEYRKAVIYEAVTKGLDSHAPMKGSGIEWIDEMPESWKIARLDGVAARKSGHTPDKKVPEYWDGDIVWISLADSPRLRANVFVNESTSMTTEAGIANSSAELLPAGAVLLSRDASVGLTAIAGVPLAVSQHFMAYICSDGLNNQYLRYVFLAMHQEFEKMSMGSTIPTIGLPLIHTLTIPFPPREEQDGIVVYLDTKNADIDSLIGDNQQMADKLREYRRSLISEAVTGKFKVPGVDG